MTISPDFSAIDRAVERVIARHDCLFRMELISREKVDDGLHPMVKISMICSRASRMAAEVAKLKAISFRGNNLTQQNKMI